MTYTHTPRPARPVAVTPRYAEQTTELPARDVTPRDYVAESATGIFRPVSNVRLTHDGFILVFGEGDTLYMHHTETLFVLCRGCAYRSGDMCPAHSGDVWAGAR